MKEFKHLGTYGLIIENDEILLINKKGGPYDGKLDLPGGTIEFCERPEDALKRELVEETKIKIKDFELFDADSVSFTWQYNKEKTFKVHHIGIFYKIKNYDILKGKVSIDNNNNDSLGANFYKISELNKNNLSQIALIELEKLGYTLK